MPIMCSHRVTGPYRCRHKHPGVEFLYIRQGEGTLHCGHHIVPFAVPVLAWYPGSAPHGVEVRGTYARWNLIYWPEALDDRVPEFRTLKPPVPFGVAPVPEQFVSRLDRLFDDIHSEECLNDPYSWRVIAHQIVQLALNFQRFREAGGLTLAESPAEGLDPSAAPHHHVSALLTYIEERLHEPLAVQDLAAAFNYSKAHIHRLVRTATGRSVLDYIRARRIARARTLLEMTDLPIAQIACQVGIPNLSTFYKAFRAETGNTPREVRRSGRPAAPGRTPRPTGPGR